MLILTLVDTLATYINSGRITPLFLLKTIEMSVKVNLPLLKLLYTYLYLDSLIVYEIIHINHSAVIQIQQRHGLNYVKKPSLVHRR